MRVGVTSRSFSRHPILRRALLDKYPDTIFNDAGEQLSGESLVEFLTECDAAITALETIDESIVSRLPNLKLISKYGVGLDMIDQDALVEHDVKLFWMGGVNKRSVSELVVSNAIALLHKVPFANSEVKDGSWYQVKGRQLTGKNIGIVGCGHIGKDLVKLLQPYNCKIRIHDILLDSNFNKKYNLQPTGLHTLLSLSDVVTLHLPLDDTTSNIIGPEELALMKSDAVFINYARGGLVDEKSLYDVLSHEKIGGAALDVFVDEPNDLGFENLHNVIVTPHIGGSTEEAILAMGLSAIEGLILA